MPSRHVRLISHVLWEHSPDDPLAVHLLSLRSFSPCSNEASKCFLFHSDLRDLMIAICPDFSSYEVFS